MTVKTEHEDSVAASQQDVLYEVARELGRQLNRWSVQSHEPLLWLAILGEEVGEVCKAAIDPGVSASDYRMELLQVAAVAVAAIECLDRRAHGMQPTGSINE